MHTHSACMRTHRFEAGVHIADVTHFLKPDTPMDLEAAARATSVYASAPRRCFLVPRPVWDVESV